MHAVCNGIAYFARAVIYVPKMFMKLKRPEPVKLVIGGGGANFTRPCSSFTLVKLFTVSSHAA